MKTLLRQLPGTTNKIIIYLCPMTTQWEANDLSELNEIAKAIITSISPKKMIAFYGEMGAGKTTLIKEICLHLGVVENTSSPTFAIVNEYNGREKIYHFDLYRIKNLEELLAIGIEEYLDSGNYMFVEWPELLEPLMDKELWASIYIETDPNQKRIITLGS